MDRTAGRPLDVRVLGPVEVVGPGGPVELRPGLARVLLLALVLRAGRAVPADVLVKQLWGDRPPENPANSLQVNVSYLRRQLRTAGDGIAIERVGGGYRLAVAPDAVDNPWAASTVEQRVEVLRALIENELPKALAGLVAK